MQSAVVILVPLAPIDQTGKATVTESSLIHHTPLMGPADLLYMLLLLTAASTRLCHSLHYCIFPLCTLHI